VVEELLTGFFRHARLNYANGDMVGHTGELDASVIAVEAIDLSIGRLVSVIEKLKGALVVTADHGNADEMFERDRKTGAYALDKSGRKIPKTSHSLNPVPFHVYAPDVTLALNPLVKNPGLVNLAATLLHLIGYDRPDGYEPSLIAS
jgi:2,3-bisphosphoglycerate-independent phosphoglycerate mutase